MTLNILAAINNFEYIVAIVGFVIVSVALSLLVVVFSQIPKLLKLNLRNKLRREGKEVAANSNLQIEGNVNAAIAMALHMYFNEQHDEESGIVTIKQVKRRYSPWSSKLYSVYNNWPQRR
jgi:Na+-transporting methylmalonyl-CoA/oxaloacetate decarboxylase gamma subunit